MKRFLALILLVVAPAAFAGEHIAASFFGANVSSICVSNTLGVTNLNSYGVITTNIQYMQWTNGAGDQVRAAGDGTGPDYQNVIGSVNLEQFSTRDQFWIGNASLAANTVTNTYYSQIFIRLVGQSGANTACTFVFAPVWDDDPLDASTDTATYFTVAVTSNGATPVTSRTPIPAYQLYGAKRLRLVSVTHPDADATSRVTVLKCELCGYK